VTAILSYIPFTLDLTFQICHFKDTTQKSIEIFRGDTRYTGYFTSDNEPDGIENVTHNTFAF
jgi:hypothetical protein